MKGHNMYNTQKITKKQAVALYLEAFYSFVVQTDYTDAINRNELLGILTEIVEQINANYTLKNDLTTDSVAEFLTNTIFGESEKSQLLEWINSKLAENDPIKNYFGE